MKRWMTYSRTAGVATLVACLAAGSAFAQEGGRGGRGGRGFGGGGFGLFRPSVMTVADNEAAQKDVGFSEEQVAKIKALSEEYSKAVSEALPEGRGGAVGGERPSREEMQKRRAEQQAAIEKVVADYRPKLAEIATADQMKRLDQIVLQARGPAGLTDEAVAKELGLTEEQTKKLAEVTREYAAKQRELGGGGQGGGNREDFQERMEKIRELNEERDEALVAVLTAEQQEKLKGLKGEKFDVSKLRSSFGGPGGGGRGGQGRRGGNN